VCYHRVGTGQDRDELEYRRPDHPEWAVASPVTPDGRYLLLVVREADDDRTRILYKDLAKPDGAFVELIDRFEHQFHFIGNDGPVFYFMTNRDADELKWIKAGYATLFPCQENEHGAIDRLQQRVAERGTTKG
jgi:prolyl oligopeptidase